MLPRARSSRGCPWVGQGRAWQLILSPHDIWSCIGGTRAAPEWDNSARTGWEQARPWAHRQRSGLCPVRGTSIRHCSVVAIDQTVLVAFKAHPKEDFSHYSTHPMCPEHSEVTGRTVWQKHPFPWHPPHKSFAPHVVPQHLAVYLCGKAHRRQTHKSGLPGHTQTFLPLSRREPLLKATHWSAEEQTSVCTLCYGLTPLWAMTQPPHQAEEGPPASTSLTAWPWKPKSQRWHWCSQRVTTSQQHPTQPCCGLTL